VADSPILQLAEHVQPKLRAFRRRSPEAQHIARTVGLHAERDVERALFDLPTLAHADEERVDVDDGIDRVERTSLPRAQLVHDGVGSARDEVGRDIGAVQLAQVTLDVARRHASRVESDDFLVEALEPPLSLGQEPRLERALAVPGNAHFDRASLGLDGLRRIAVAYVATSPPGLLLVTEVLGHFRFEEALHQRAFQLREQALW